MVKLDFYESMGMSKFFGGGSFEIVTEQIDLNNYDTVYSVLDKVCVQENLTPISLGWKEIDFADSNNLLKSALRFDLAFRESEIMPKEQAETFQKQIIKRVDEDNCKCFTNWFNNPWDPMEDSESLSWNSISESTYDLAIVFISSNNLIFTYFLGED